MARELDPMQFNNLYNEPIKPMSSGQTLLNFQNYEWVYVNFAQFLLIFEKMGFILYYVFCCTFTIHEKA